MVFPSAISKNGSLLRSWKEWRNYIKIDALKQLSLLSVKNSYELYPTLGIYFGWFLAIAAVCIYLKMESWYLFLLFGWSIFCMLSLRPSLDRRTVPYFIDFISTRWLMALLLVLSLVSLPLQGLVIPLGYIFVFFALEVPSTFTTLIVSGARTVKFAWYNLPLYIVLVAITYGFIALGNALGSCGICRWLFLGLLLVLPFLINFLLNLLIKRIHDNFELYYFTINVPKPVNERE